MQLLEQCDRNCHDETADLGPFLGWADCMVELQMLDEREAA